MLLNEIIKNKELLDSFGLVPDETKNNLGKWFKIECTYNSNAIRNNRLSKMHIAKIIDAPLDNIDKNSRNYIDTINYLAAMDYAEKFALDSKKKLTLTNILELHKILLKNIDDENSGRIRTSNIKITGSEVRLPDHKEIPFLIDQFIVQMACSTDHPAKLAADAHLSFFSMHPFLDGNGRVARIILNMILMQNGYPPAVILAHNRFSYISSIEKAQVKGDCFDYYKVIFRAIEWGLDICIGACNG